MTMNKLYISSINNFSDEDFDKYYKKASIQRKEAIDILHYMPQKKLSLMAEMLLVYGLKQNKLYKKIEYVFGTNGKPYLKNNINFNFSHSEDYAICAISDDEIGCDIEKIKEANLATAKRFYSEKEYENVLKDNSKFFKYWTLKESYLKANGVGIKGLKEALIDIDTFTMINDKDYHLHEIGVIDGYSVAVCTKNDKEIESELVCF